MSSLVSLVRVHGIIAYGDGNAAKPDQATKALQVALSASGYRVGVDGIFGLGTLSAVKRFQTQHGLTVDGRVGLGTAALLDAPHDVLVAAATPMVHAASSFPHDDTASLIAYYGNTGIDHDHWHTVNVTTVPCPWHLYYEGVLWPHPIQFHRKAAEPFAKALGLIWEAAGHNNSSPILRRVKHFSGSGNFRPVRGSSRLSTHAFWAAIDFDAEDLPLGKGLPSHDMPQEVVDAFVSNGFFWGGNYVGRKDPMHFQAAHE